MKACLKECVKSLSGKNQGFTLSETLLAGAIVAMIALGLYWAGDLLMKMSIYNNLSIEAEGLAISKLEEIRGLDPADIIQQVPFPDQTIPIRNNDFHVVRRVDVIGHAVDRSVASNLAQSAYLEIHVDATFLSPFDRSANTVTYSTLVGN